MAPPWVLMETVSVSSPFFSNKSKTTSYKKFQHCKNTSDSQRQPLLAPSAATLVSSPSTQAAGLPPRAHGGRLCAVPWEAGTPHSTRPEGRSPPALHTGCPGAHPQARPAGHLCEPPDAQKWGRRGEGARTVGPRPAAGSRLRAGRDRATEATERGCGGGRAGGAQRRGWASEALPPVEATRLHRGLEADPRRATVFVLLA